MFTDAVLVDGVWWVVRRNSFPDHPMYTFFVDGRCVGDFDTPPPAWSLRVSGRPVLTAAERQEVLRLMSGLGPYGAEAGQPCDDIFCTCDIRTDVWAGHLDDR